MKKVDRVGHQSGADVTWPMTIFFATSSFTGVRLLKISRNQEMGGTPVENLCSARLMMSQTDFD